MQQCYDKDISSLFDDCYDPTSIAEAFQTSFLANTVVNSPIEQCTHKKLENWINGKSFCVECGVIFKDDKIIDIKDCKHEEVNLEDNGLYVCIECGQEIENLDHTPEWRHYGANDTRGSKDPSRCHRSKTAPKGVAPVFDAHKIQVSKSLIAIVDMKYKKVLEVLGEEDRLLREQEKNIIDEYNEYSDENSSEEECNKSAENTENIIGIYPKGCTKSNGNQDNTLNKTDILNNDSKNTVKKSNKKPQKKPKQTTVYRGKGRESIIANCLFYAYIDIGEYRTSNYIRKKFNLTQKKMSNGKTKYFKAFPEDAVKHITPEKLLPWLMTLTGVPTVHYKPIAAIVKYLQYTSELMQRSNPQSVAAAVIFFYLCLFPKVKDEVGLTKVGFAKKAQLSDITVTKLVRDIVAISKESIDM